jgi:hypothetical protein
MARFGFISSKTKGLSKHADIDVLAATSMQLSTLRQKELVDGITYNCLHGAVAGGFAVHKPGALRALARKLDVATSQENGVVFACYLQAALSLRALQ